MAKTYEPIATYTLSSSGNGATFSSIPSTYTDLILVVNGSLNTTNYLTLTLNADTAGNYSYTSLTGNGTSASSARGSNNGYAFGGQFTTSQSVAIWHIQNYSNTTTYKTVLNRNNAASGYVDAVVTMWRNTAAINTVYISSGNGSATFTSGSTFTLYGIKQFT